MTTDKAPVTVEQGDEHLAPCPFCGDEYVEVHMMNAISNGARVHCDACDAFGPPYFGSDADTVKRAAAGLWNDRAALEEEIKRLREALKVVPIPGKTEPMEAFYYRMNRWLAGEYRTALEGGGS